MRKYPVPVSVKVGAIDYDIHIDLEVLDKLANPVISNGVSDLLHQTIALRPGMGPLIERWVLLHEILHAALRSAGEVMEDEAEEKLVDPLAHVLLQLVRDNPELIAYLAS